MGWTVCGGVSEQALGCNEVTGHISVTLVKPQDASRAAVSPVRPTDPTGRDTDGIKQHAAPVRRTSRVRGKCCLDLVDREYPAHALKFHHSPRHHVRGCLRHEIANREPPEIF